MLKAISSAQQIDFSEHFAYHVPVSEEEKYAYFIQIRAVRCTRRFRRVCKETVFTILVTRTSGKLTPELAQKQLEESQVLREVLVSSDKPTVLLRGISIPTRILYSLADLITMTGGQGDFIAEVGIFEMREGVYFRTFSVGLEELAGEIIPHPTAQAGFERIGAKSFN